MSSALDPLRQAMEEYLNGPPTKTVVLRHAGNTYGALSTQPTVLWK